MYEKELLVAKELVRTVGAYLRSTREQNDIVRQPHGEGFLDVTTQADLEAERIVIETLMRTFPGDHILSEETRTDYSADWERVWIIDPLDGTTNYVKGFDTYAVSIAFLLRGRVMLAIVGLPAYGRVYHAVRGQGVYRNDILISLVRPEDSLAQSLVSVGFPHNRQEEFALPAFTLYKDLWLAASDLRRSASAVYDGCILAEGITGAYVTPDIKPWDIAATSLFVTEQGGSISGLGGEPLDLFRRHEGRFSTAAVFSKNKKIHEAILDITREYQ